MKRAVDKADAYDLERTILCCIDEMADTDKFYAANYNPKNPVASSLSTSASSPRPILERGRELQKVAGLVRSKLRVIFNDLHVRHPVVVIDPKWRFLDFITNKNEKITWCGTSSAT